MSLLAGSTLIASTADMLRDAIRKLPPPAMAGIPLKQRNAFLDYFNEDHPKDRRLDEKYGCVSFYSDGEVPFDAKFAFEVKIFRVHGGGNLAFCCDSGWSYIFRQQSGQWVDVTDEYLPKGIKVDCYFRPRRKLPIIEGEDYKSHDAAQTRRFDLVWDGTKFNVRKARSSKYHYDFQ